MFSLFKVIDTNSNHFPARKSKTKKQGNRVKAKVGDKFSINDLIAKDKDFLDDKVFMIEVVDDTSSFFDLEQTYKYVLLKVKNLDEGFLV